MRAVRNRHVLVADDDRTTVQLLQSTLVRWGYEVSVCAHGKEALDTLRQSGSAPIALLDWLMPGMDGAEVCGLLRANPETASKYLILLTSKASKDDLVAGLRAGADDYIIKPFHLGELRARLLVGTRVVTLQKVLTDRVSELTAAMTNVKRLEELIPVCSSCNNVRSDPEYWQRVYGYLKEHKVTPHAQTICPTCRTQGDDKAAG
jgi:phosphoserine phosphatase RsbU/P